MLFSYVPFGVTVMVLGCPDYLHCYYSCTVVHVRDYILSNLDVYSNSLQLTSPTLHCSQLYNYSWGADTIRSPCTCFQGGPRIKICAQGRQNFFGLQPWPPPSPAIYSNFACENSFFRHYVRQNMWLKLTKILASMQAKAWLSSVWAKKINRITYKC